ncbi:hypothetical protein WJX73_005032 [Symbiochloris irregularis]|uniref:Ubiquinone biosynthesis protein COQ4 homolog, mitochondrial n=1 Tax=Symbiochloris irregularis TaxID=706552 RepID=A0AAW1PIK3_9CHLO
MEALHKSCALLKGAPAPRAFLLCARSLASSTESWRFDGTGQSVPDLSARDRLYPNHQPLNFIQRGAVAVFSAFGAALRPERADLVAALGETTGSTAFRAMQSRMLQSTVGRRILAEKPRITDAVLDQAASQAPGTLGHAYGQYMGRRHFRADERPPVRFLDDRELAYVAQRARETHDLWHVLFNCPTTVLGELTLKGLEFVQTGLPMAALSVAGAQWRLKQEDRVRLNSQLLPWALRAGSECADLMCIYYEEHFQENLETLRQRWRITPAPLVARAGALATSHADGSKALVASQPPV